MVGRKFSSALTLLAILAAGCSGQSSPAQWLGLDSKSTTTDKGVFYSSVEGLTVRNAPSSSASIVGQLALHQKVHRSKVADGYAEIKAADGSVGGWVVNAKLIWKLPTTGTSNADTSETTEDTSTPVPDSDSSPPAVEVPEQPARKSGGGASVFDPY